MPLQVLHLAHRIYMRQKKYHDALRVALRINEPAVIEATFAACTDVLERRQLGYLLGRHGTTINLEEGAAAVEVRQRSAMLCIILLMVWALAGSVVSLCVHVTDGAPTACCMQPQYVCSQESGALSLCVHSCNQPRYLPIRLSPSPDTFWHTHCVTLLCASYCCAFVVLGTHHTACAPSTM